MFGRPYFLPAIPLTSTSILSVVGQHYSQDAVYQAANRQVPD
jgi:hypothetical protein